MITTVPCCLLRFGPWLRVHRHGKEELKEVFWPFLLLLILVLNVYDFFLKLSLTSNKWYIILVVKSHEALKLCQVREPWLCAICLQGSAILNPGASTVASLAGVIVNLPGYVGLDGEPTESCQFGIGLVSLSLRAQKTWTAPKRRSLKGTKLGSKQQVAEKGQNGNQARSWVNCICTLKRTWPGLMLISDLVNNLIHDASMCFLHPEENSSRFASCLVTMSQPGWVHWTALLFNARSLCFTVAARSEDGGDPGTGPCWKTSPVCVSCTLVTRRWMRVFGPKRDGLFHQEWKCIELMQHDFRKDFRWTSVLFSSRSLQNLPLQTFCSLFRL